MNGNSAHINGLHAVYLSRHIHDAIEHRLVWGTALETHNGFPLDDLKRWHIL